MKILIILWVLNLDNLGTHQYIFKGTLAECKVEANEMQLQNHEDMVAGCYQTIKTAPWMNRNSQ